MGAKSPRLIFISVRLTMNMTLEVYCVWGERIRDIEPKDIGVRYGRVVQTRDGADEDEGCVGRRNSL